MSDFSFAMQRLREEISDDEFNANIRPLAVGQDGNQVRLYAPNVYVSDRVRRRYVDRMVELYVQAGAKEAAPEVSVVVGEPNRGPVQAGAGEKVAKRSVTPYSQTLDPAYTFESFVEGPCNRMVREAALQVADAPGGDHSPLVLHGSVGLGKTHLMRAIGHRIQGRQNGQDVVFFHGQRFLDTLLPLISRREGAEVRKIAARCGGADVLLMDDIQFLAVSPKVQEEFFKIFNALIQNGKQIVLTSDRYPGLIREFLPGLNSRIGSGLNLEVKAPSRATRIAILKRKAAAKGETLPTKVAQCIAEMASRSVRELESGLNQVIQCARLKRAPLTVELVREELRHLASIRSRRVDMDAILLRVADRYNLRSADLLSKRRYRYLVEARHMAMYLAKELTRRSYADIGRAFGGRNHATVKNACDRMARELQSRPDVEADYNRLVQELVR